MRKKQYRLMAILAGVLTSMALRYPLVPHEQGWDSFIIHQMAQSVNRFGYMKWIIHPLSYIGYYPYSYSSGIPAVLSTISQISGLNIEHSILFFCFVESILFFILAYMAASQFTNRFMFRIFIAFAYSISPGVIWFTDWTISTRGALIMLIPLFIYALFKASKTYERRYHLVAAIVFLMAMTVHNMFVFLLLILFSYLFSRFIYLLNLRRTKLVDSSESSKFRLLIHGFFLIILLGLVYAPILFNIGTANYTSLDTETIKHIGIEYGAKVGIIFLALPFGMYFLIRKKRKGIPETFLLVTSILIAPIFLSPYYVSLGFLFIFLMLCGYSLLPLLSGTRERVKIEKVRAILVAVLIVSVGLWSVQSKMHIISTKSGPVLDENYCEDSLYEASIVFSHMGGGGFVSNDYAIHGRISAYSQRPNIVDRVYLINGYVSPSDMCVHLKDNPMDWFNGGPYEDRCGSVLEYRYWSPLRYWPSDLVLKELKERYNTDYYIENNQISGDMNYYNKDIVHSRYFTYLDGSEYVLYRNSKVSVMYLE